MIKILAAFLLPLCLFTDSAIAQVEVRIAIVPKKTFSSTNRKDFKRIKNCDLTLICVNKKSEAIKIPRGYSSETVRICSSGSFGTRIPMVLGARDNARLDKTLIHLAAGKEHEMLRVDAATVLLSPGNQYALNPKAEFAKPRWVWHWSARPGSDYSPFESRKGDKRTDHAVLWCEIDLDGQTLRSVPILVTRKDDQG